MFYNCKHTKFSFKKGSTFADDLWIKAMAKYSGVRHEAVFLLCLLSKVWRLTLSIVPREIHVL
jgi:hypothetical protein